MKMRNDRRELSGRMTIEGREMTTKEYWIYKTLQRKQLCGGVQGFPIGVDL